MYCLKRNKKVGQQVRGKSKHSMGTDLSVAKVAKCEIDSNEVRLVFCNYPWLGAAQVLTCFLFISNYASLF